MNIEKIESVENIEISKDIDFRIIAAFDENRAIGVGNKLPWSLPDDLRHFKNLTMGNVLLMGRKTYESIGRPLPGRETLVLSRNKYLKIPGCMVVNNLDQVNQYMFSKHYDKHHYNKVLYCVGGANLYSQLIDQANSLYITEVYTKVLQADAYFPVIDKSLWQEVAHDLGMDKAFDKKHFKDEKHKYDFAFKQYLRII